MNMKVFQNIFIITLMMVVLGVSTPSWSQTYVSKEGQKIFAMYDEACNKIGASQISEAVGILQEIIAKNVDTSMTRNAKCLIEEIVNPEYDLKPLVREMQMAQMANDFSEGRMTLPEGKTKEDIYRGIIRNYQEILTQYPDIRRRPAIYSAIAYCYRYDIRDYNNALLYLHKMVSEYPKSVSVSQAYYSMGELYCSLRKEDAAADAFSKYLETKPYLEGSPLSSLQTQLAINSIVSIYEKQGKDELCEKTLLGMIGLVMDKALIRSLKWRLARFYRTKKRYNESIALCDGIIAEYYGATLEERKNMPTPHEPLLAATQMCIDKEDYVKAKGYCEHILNDFTSKENKSKNEVLMKKIEEQIKKQNEAVLQKDGRNGGR